MPRVRTRRPPHTRSLRKFFSSVELNAEQMGFAAKVFGAVYEDLLEHAFRKQRTTRYGDVLEWAGGVWVRMPGGTKKIPVDFLLKRKANPRRLICFEAKSWPGYAGFGVISASNAAAFASRLGKFADYIRNGEWFIHETTEIPESSQSSARPPDSFGVIVFDYAKADERKILAAFRQVIGPKVTEIASICALLRTTERYRTIGRTDGSLDTALRAKLRLAEDLFRLYVPTRTLGMPK